MKSLEIEDIKEILRIEIREQILQAHHIDLVTIKGSDSATDKNLEKIEKGDYDLRGILKDNLKSYLKKVDSKMTNIIVLQLVV